MTDPARLTRPTAAELTGQHRQLYDALTGGSRSTSSQRTPLVDEEGRLQGPFNAFLLSPAIGDALQQLGAAVRFRSQLADRVREMAILAVAAHEESLFEAAAHTAIGRSAGLTPEELEVLNAGRVPALDDADESAALTVVRALLDTGDLDDGEYETAVAQIGAAAVFELTTLVGYYVTLALQLRVFRANE